VKPVDVPGLPIRLNPPEVKVPSTSPKAVVFPAMMLLLTVQVPLLSRFLLIPHSLLVIVLLVTFRVVL
jgi:hypothetical protein